jgi:hypothetical protein
VVTYICNALLKINNMNIKIIICIFFVNFSFGQEKIIDFDLTKIKERWDVTEAFILKDNNSDNYFAILEEISKTQGLKFNKEGELIKHFTTDKLERKYREIIGHVFKDNKLLVIRINSTKNKFAYIKYDFLQEATEEAVYETESSSDIFMESFITKNSCIIYTFDIYDDILKKWDFKIDGSFIVKEIDIQSQFIKNGITNNNLGDYIIKKKGLDKFIDLVKVNNRIPNNIEITSSANKMYENEQSFIWTLDDDLEHTLLLHFNYPDYEPEMRIIEKLSLENGRGKSNSFLFEDKIAQVLSNSKELIVEIKSLANPENQFKELRVTKDENISFKNSSILQEGSMYSYGSTREMEKTSKLLRKMSADDNGISVHKNNDKYHVTIGGKRERRSTATAMPGFGTFPGSQFGGMNLSFNPTFHAFDMYNNTDSTRIECMFDEEFNHVEGEIEKNVFDRINEINEFKKSYIVAKTISYLNNQVFYGYWNTNINKFILHRFD